MSKSALQRECDRVNGLLKAEAKALKLGVKGVSLERLDATRGDLQMFSYWGKMEFREFCRRMLERRGQVAATELIRDGARMLRLSSETTKRYLRELRAAGGPLAGLGDTVILNGRYRPVEEDEYWLEEESGEKRVESREQKAEGTGRRSKVEGRKAQVTRPADAD